MRTNQMTILDRLAAYVEIRDSGCYEWVASKRRLGYGQVRHNGTSRIAHVVAYLELVGPVPEGKVLDHICRNPPCVNPDHLEPVSIGENTRRGELGYGGRNRCRNGIHDITDAANIYVRPDGQRECMGCVLIRREKAKAVRAARKARAQ